jgi:hypothetical protein
MCFGTLLSGGLNQISSGSINPDDPDLDRGNCDQNRTHIGNLTLGYQTPEFASPGLRASSTRVRAAG